MTKPEMTKNVDTDEAAIRGKSGVVGDDGQNCDRPKPLDVRAQASVWDDLGPRDNSRLSVGNVKPPFLPEASHPRD